MSLLAQNGMPSTLARSESASNSQPGSGDGALFDMGKSRLVVNISQQLLSEDMRQASTGAMNLAKLLISEGGIEILLQEPAGQVAFSQIGVLLHTAANKGPQCTDAEKHAAHSATVALREIVMIDKGLERVLVPDTNGDPTRNISRLPGLGVNLLEGLTTMLQEPVVDVVLDATACWAHLLRSPLSLAPLMEMPDRRFRSLIVGLLGAMHIKGTDAIPFAGHALQLLICEKRVAERMMAMPTLDALIVQEMTALLRNPEVIRWGSSILCALANHAEIRMRLMNDAPNFELLFHQLVAMMGDASVPYAAVVLCAFAQDMESRKALLSMNPARMLVTELTNLINPSKSALAGPAAAVLRCFTEDWASQSRVLSLTADPFLLAASVMFQ
eukprot:gene10748-12716_t